MRKLGLSDVPLSPDNPAPIGAPVEIIVDALDPATMDLWRTVAKVAKTLDDQHMRWCLVGGLMVALFAMEAGQSSRPTTDIDILGDARQRPSGTEWVTEQLTKLVDATVDAAMLRTARAAYRRLTR
jgi:hypothetical protein